MDNETKPSIHTLESDLASAVRDKDYGKNIVKIITDPNRKTVEPPREKIAGNMDIKKLSIILVILLLIASIITFFILYRPAPVVSNTSASTESPTNTQKQATSTAIIKNSTVLNPEIIKSSNFSDLNKQEIVNEINKIKGIILENKVTPYNNISIQTNISLNTFFEKIRYSGSSGLIRSLEDNYAFGIYSMPNDNFETYILIRISDFDLSLKSMLDWEKYIALDIKDIFTSNNISSNSTTTVIYKNKDTKNFIDKIIKNHDIREYVDNQTNTTIVYGFINNKYLLITSGESSFIDIKDRLLKENISR